MEQAKPAGPGMPPETLAALENSTLFSGFSAEELHTLLPLLAARTQRFAKGAALLLQGYQAADVGVVLAGRIEAAKTSAAGAEVVVARQAAGGVYGDVLAAGGVKSPVTVTAATDCTVLLLPRRRLFCTGPHGDLRMRLVENLTRAISEKYFGLDRRLEILMMHRLRQRLAAWLLGEAARRGKPAFTHGMTRAELARHLGCERSALSREISRMAADGLVACTPRGFAICDAEALARLFI